jgi:hypothetical protein
MRAHFVLAILDKGDFFRSITYLYRILGIFILLNSKSENWHGQKKAEGSDYEIGNYRSVCFLFVYRPSNRNLVRHDSLVVFWVSDTIQPRIWLASSF